MFDLKIKLNQTLGLKLKKKPIKKRQKNKIKNHREMILIQI